jgi:hypothetical protein
MGLDMGLDVVDMDMGTDMDMDAVDMDDYDHIYYSEKIFYICLRIFHCNHFHRIFFSLWRCDHSIYHRMVCV